MSDWFCRLCRLGTCSLRSVSCWREDARLSVPSPLGDALTDARRATDAVLRDEETRGDVVRVVGVLRLAVAGGVGRRGGDVVAMKLSEMNALERHGWIHVNRCQSHFTSPSTFHF